MSTSITRAGALALALVALALVALAACTDTRYNTADTAHTVDTAPIVSALTSQSWSFTEHTAALCNDSGEVWTFDEGGAVEVTWWSDAYPDGEDSWDCDTSSRTDTGTFHVDEGGVVFIQLDGEPRERAWQVAVDAMASAAGDMHPFLTRQAWRADEPGGRAFSLQHQDAQRYSSAWASVDGALTLDREGACGLTVTLEATADHDGEVSEAATSDTVACRVEELGDEDWMVVVVAGDTFIDSPEMATRADWAVHEVRYTLVSSGQSLMFRRSAPDVLIPDARYTFMR